MKSIFSPVRPHVEGYIKHAVTRGSDSDGITFLGYLEVTGRHHTAGTLDLKEPPRRAEHSITQELMQHQPNQDAQKLIEIPIRMFFNTTENALNARYQAFNEKGHPVCTGDGAKAQRQAQAGSAPESVACSGPARCVFAQDGVRCRLQVTLTVQPHPCKDPLSVFEVRTASFNAHKSMLGQLSYLEARFKGLRNVPLRLTTYLLSNAPSDFQPFPVFRLHLDAASEQDALETVRQARSSAPDEDLNLNDTVFGQADWTDDFEVIQEFYDPLPSTRTGKAQRLPNGQTLKTAAADQYINSLLAPSDISS